MGSPSDFGLERIAVDRIGCGCWVGFVVVQMNMRKAFGETLDLARSRGMSLDTEAASDYRHLVSMYQRLTDDFSDGKLGRWLGWAQCTICSAGYGTLDEMRQINRLAA